MKNKYPVFIICRDRVTCLKELISWLEKARQEEIYLVDNDSTYTPLLEYYKQTPHTVLYQHANTRHTGIWYNGTIERYSGDRRFIVTDPDVVPTDECPLDAIDKFTYLLDKYPERTKAGFSLKIDDLPDHFKFKPEVIRHESPYLNWGGPEHDCSFAPIDTTFALYQKHTGPEISYSIRTLAPYEARHLPWYIDSNNIDDEERYYREHMDTTVNSWNQDIKPRWC